MTISFGPNQSCTAGVMAANAAKTDTDTVTIGQSEHIEIYCLLSNELVAEEWKSSSSSSRLVVANQRLQLDCVGMVVADRHGRAALCLHDGWHLCLLCDFYRVADSDWKGSLHGFTDHSWNCVFWENLFFKKKYFFENKFFWCFSKDEQNVLCFASWLAGMASIASIAISAEPLWATFEFLRGCGTQILAVFIQSYKSCFVATLINLVTI